MINLGIENETLEYKKSTAELDEAINSIVAILNKHNKGVLYFGVKNNGEIIGQQVSEKTLREISQAIGNFIEPKIYPEINKLYIDKMEIAEVKFEGYETPYFGYGKARIRIADEDILMSRNELIKYIKNKTYESDWEKQVSDQNINKVNIEDLKGYILKAKKVKRIDFEFSDVESSLDKLSLIKDDKLLNAGMVLFSESLYSELQMAVFATDQRLTFLDIDRKRGNIFDLVNTAEDYVKRNINWRVKFDGSMERKEIPEIPIEAIREALINSFAHKDYGTCQTNEVAVYKDRVEIYNPGTFPDEHNPEDYINDNLRPIRRNPLIASILYYSKDMESFGTGLKRISDLCNKANCKYEFEKQKYGFVVKFYRNILGTTTQDGTQVGTQDNNRENAILNFCKTPKSSEEILHFIGIKSRKYLREKILRPLLSSNKLNMTIPDKPNSKLQKYINKQNIVEIDIYKDTNKNR